MTLRNKRLNYILLSIPIILLIPFIAMQFTTDVNWSVFDFLIMGILLLSTGLMMELILQRVKSKKHRMMLCMAVLVMFLIVWARNPPIKCCSRDGQVCQRLFSVFKHLDDLLASFFWLDKGWISLDVLQKLLLIFT